MKTVSRKRCCFRHRNNNRLIIAGKLCFSYKRNALAIDVGFRNLLFFFIEMMIANIFMACHHTMYQGNGRYAKQEQANQKKANELAAIKKSV